MRLIMADIFCSLLPLLCSFHILPIACHIMAQLLAYVSHSYEWLQEESWPFSSIAPEFITSLDVEVSTRGTCLIMVPWEVRTSLRVHIMTHLSNHGLKDPSRLINACHAITKETHHLIIWSLGNLKAMMFYVSLRKLNIERKKLLCWKGQDR